MEIRKDGESVIYCFSVEETDVLRAIFRYITQDIDSEDKDAEEVLPQLGSTIHTLANTAVGDYIMIFPLEEKDEDDEVEDEYDIEGEGVEIIESNEFDSPTFSLMDELRKFSDETNKVIRRLRREGEYRKFYEPYVDQRKALGIGAQLLLENIAAETARFTVENDGVPPPEYFLS